MIIRMRNKLNAHNIGEAFCIIIAILSTIIVLLWALSVPAQELTQKQLMKKAATAKVGDILSRYSNIEIYKADSGKLTSKIYATPQYDANGKSLIKYDTKTGKVITRNRYVKFIPDLITGKLEVKREVGNANIKEYWTVPDKNITKLSWTVKTDAERIVEDDALIFLDSQNIELFRTPAPTAWDMDKNPVDLKVIFDGEVLTYEILDGIYKYPITIDPTITVNVSNIGTPLCTGNKTWAEVRDSNVANGLYPDFIGVGAGISGSGFAVSRGGLTFSGIPKNIDFISSATLVLDGYSCNLANNFNICIFRGTWTGDSIKISDFIKFDGRQIGKPHNGVSLCAPWNTSNYSNDDNTFTFLSAGRDLIKACAGDTLRLMIISSIDSSNTEPTGTSRILFTGSADPPYLNITHLIPGGLTRTVPYDKEPNYIWKNGNVVPIWKP